MSITLANAQAILDNLVESQVCGVNEFTSVSIAGRTVTYRNAQELSQLITYWSRVVAELRRTAAGRSRHGYSVADFRSNK
jgi:NADH/NAD ratio-sensing transcriptional regulator Rex